jgi:hypothetical protein
MEEWLVLVLAKVKSTGRNTMSDYTLVQFRTAIRSDLADGGSYWSDNEIDRAVIRAVADLSRVAPREKTKEITLDFTVTSESVTTLATTSTNAIVAAKDISATVSGDTCTIAGQPDLPRPLKASITDANASMTLLVLTIVGLDENSRGISEVLLWTKSSTLSISGTKNFKYVESITVTNIAGNGAGDVLNIGYGDTTTGKVFLDYKPIKKGSETVKNTAGTTTYTRDTDYEIDYSNGSLKLITGGTMAASTEYYVSYTKSQITVDLSDITDLISVLEIEYPLGNIPQDTISYGVFGNLLTIEGGEASDQEQMSDTNHLVVRYHAQHTEPTTNSTSTYPSFLDQTVCQLAEAYLLFNKAYKYDQQAATDFASARTELDNCTAVNTAMETALGAAATALGNASIGTSHTEAETALDAAKTALDAVITALGSANVDTYLTGASAPSVNKYLTDGDAYLNTVNVGANVPENHATYALRSQGIAESFIAKASKFTDEANARVSEAMARLQRIDRYVSQAEGYIAEAAGRQGKADRYIQEADRYISIAYQHLAMATSFRTDAQEKRNEVWTIWQGRVGYISDTSSTSLKQSKS